MHYSNTGAVKDEVTGKWERILNEEFHALYTPPNTLWVIISRRMRWAGNVARMGGEKGCIQGACGGTEGKGPPGRLSVNWRITYNLIFKNWGGRHKVNWSGSEQRQRAGCCECSNKRPVSIKYGAFLN
jgi:hypothetical protein